MGICQIIRLEIPFDAGDRRTFFHAAVWDSFKFPGIACKRVAKYKMYG